MKKVLLLLLLFFSVGARAQWVSIPDTNFGTWLNTNGYSACLQGSNSAGWQMDTSCPAVVGALRVQCDSNSIHDLTGIEFFDNLNYLDCNNNQLGSLPILPTGLGTLRCYSNQLSSLPALPVNLVELLCQANQLSILPNLPVSLSNLGCDQNQLTSLPSLPSGLTILSCDENQLSSLPILPTGIWFLQCSYNPLSALPALPAALKSLQCRNAQLISLPALPNTLREIYCENNQLSSLPALPLGLTRLQCFHNQLSNLPDLPDSLYECLLWNNPLTCFPMLKTIQFLNFNNTSITCLPNYGNVHNSIPQLNTLSVCDSTNNTNGCQIFNAIEQIQIPNSVISIYPNPAPNSVTISVDESMIGGTVTICDITGRRI